MILSTKSIQMDTSLLSQSLSQVQLSARLWAARYIQLLRAGEAILRGVDLWVRLRLEGLRVALG